MASNPRALKRQKELARKERQDKKAARREQRRNENAETRKNVDPGLDPDIAGIVPAHSRSRQSSESHRSAVPRARHLRCGVGRAPRALGSRRSLRLSVRLLAVREGGSP